MQLRTKALDCLYLNWALPRAAAPELPEPLRYEVHEHEGMEHVFVSALLFRLTGLRFETLPFLRLSYPQMNCRVYVLDGDGVPSVLFRRTLVPAWIVPVSRLLGRQPASAASFSFPEPSNGARSDAWRWSIRRDTRFEVAGRVASPRLGPGPSLGSWETTLDYFRQRSRAYVVWDGQPRPITTSRPAAEVWPLRVEVDAADLVAECFGDVDSRVWREPHSAWLCPEIPFRFALAEFRALALGRGGVAAAEGC